MKNGSTDYTPLEESDDNDFSEIWDDTALIKAYDKAVKSIRPAAAATATSTSAWKMAGASNDDSAGSGAHNSKHDANRTSKPCRPKWKSSSHKRNKKTRVWNVGDRCRAVYTEDELIYDAVIKLIDHDREMCWITFDGYGNEEEKELNNLMSPETESVSSSRKGDADGEAGYESMDYPLHTHSPRQPGSEFRGHSAYGPYPGSSWYPPHQPFIPPPPPPMPWSVPPRPIPCHSYSPPSFPAPSHFPGFGFGHTVQHGGEEEELHLMLMSWYMSGYHTGYYQGLKQGHSDSCKGSPRHRHARPTTHGPRNTGAPSR